MKKFVIVVLIAGLAGVAYYTGTRNAPPAQPAAGDAGAQAGGRQGQAGGGFAGGGGFPGGGGGFGGRGGRGGRSGPLTVELGTVTRASIDQELTVVGNLVGEATVAVAPRAAGRLQEVYVRLGDRVNRGQRIAKIEDFELREQIKQAEAAQEVSQATIRQRESEVALAKTNVDRSRSLYERQLLPKQTLDDTEARYTSAVAQLDLARAQSNQSKARLDELQINLGNTIITSPVTGFIARRAVDVGASVGQNAPVVDVVDISNVRLVVNVVEKDLRELQAGDVTRVQVDAYPGETFSGRIARVSPVLDPATRTAPIEIEIPNRDYRLKPGMYARVAITLDTKKDALVVPASAVVDLGGRRGVFQPQNDIAVFRTVQVGSEQRNVTEILGGLQEGAQVITTGAGSLRDGDRVLIAAGSSRGDGRGRRGDGPAPQVGEGDPPAGGAARAGAAGSEALAAGAGRAREGGARTGTREGGAREGFAREGGAPGGRFSGEGRRGRRGGQPPVDAPQP